MRKVIVLLVWLAVFGPAIWLVMVLTRECNPSVTLWSGPLIAALGALAYTLHAARRWGAGVAIRSALVFLLALTVLWGMRRVCTDRWWDDAGPVLRWFRSV